MLLQGGSMIHHLNGNPQAAIHLLEKHLNLRPNDLEALERLATYQAELENFSDALNTWHKVLKLAPDSLNALCGAGSAYNMLELYLKAADQFEKAVSLAPQNHEIAEVLANTYLESNQYDRAAKYYKTLIGQKPDDLHLKLNLADALAHIDQTDQALALCDEILIAQADMVQAHLLKGNIFSTLGDAKKAQTSIAKALKYDPENITALTATVQKTKITKRNQGKYIPILKKLFAKRSLDPKQRAMVGFALGKAAHDMKETDKAFSYWKKGNAFQLKANPYHEEKTLLRFKTLKHIFTPVNFNTLKPDDAHFPPKAADKKMIFIVGMPRSGTSLTEQILSSHSAVYGAGELHIMGQVTEELMYYFTQQPDVKLIDRAFSSIGRAYMDAVNEMDIDEPYVVDKLPNNFLRLGFIRAAFPDAKIIHTNRDPVAVCWSNYRRYFPAKGMNFGNSLETIGTYYRHYEDLMDFWRAKFGATIYELDYARLTHNQKPETQALLDFCDLEFEQACLDFYKTNRPVRTASQNQVRRKIYTGSTKDWEVYEAHLKLLQKALARDA